MVVGQCGLVGGSLGSWVGGLQGLWVVWWLWVARIGGCGLLELFVGIVEIDFLELWVVEIGLVFAGIMGQFGGLLKSVCWNWLDVSSSFVGSTSLVIGSWGCGCGDHVGLYLDRPMVCVACDR